MSAAKMPVPAGETVPVFDRDFDGFMNFLNSGASPSISPKRFVLVFRVDMQTRRSSCLVLWRPAAYLNVGILEMGSVSVLKFACATWLLAVGFALPVPSAFATSCAKFINAVAPSSSPEACVCDESLRNLQASFPIPMKIVAACGLRWSNDMPISLARQKISLDQFTNGDIPQGEVFVTGRVKMSGQFFYEPGNAGDAWFTPRPALVARRFAALSDVLTELKIAGESEISQLGIPRYWRSTGCFTANAVIEVDGMRVLLGGNDEAGAYPLKFKVLRLSGFQKCRRQ